MSTELPAPPPGLRPGHVGVIAAGRVVLGDIAATAVDLSLRGLLRVGGDGCEPGDWTLAPVPPPGAGDPQEYEQLLLEWPARLGRTATLSSLAAELPGGLAEVRDALVRDAVHRGWLHHLRRHERTRAGTEMAARLRVFRQELRHASPRARDGQLLPWALHFGLAGPGDPMTRFTRAWASAFTGLPEWQAPARWRSTGQEAQPPPPVRRRSLHDDIMSNDVGAMLWVTGW